MSSSTSQGADEWTSAYSSVMAWARGTCENWEGRYIKGLNTAVGRREAHAARALAGHAGNVVAN